MNPNLSGPQMRRAEVYTDPGPQEHDDRWGKYGTPAPHTVLDQHGKNLGRYEEGEIEAGAGSHSWNEEQGLQGALFPGPKQTDHGYKETRSVRSVREGESDRDWNPQESEIVARTIATSDIPRRDLEGISTRVHVHSPYSWEDAGGGEIAKEDRSFFRQKGSFGKGDDIHMAPGQESSQFALTHELGHAVHFNSASGSSSYSGDAQRKAITPESGPTNSPHPVLEGTADGYADRYSGQHDHNLTPSSRMPEGDSTLRGRASQLFGEQQTGYTGRYEKSPGDDDQKPWGSADRARYLASRQFTGLTGAPMPMGTPTPPDYSDRPRLGAVHIPTQETGHMLLQADEAHYQATGQVENKQLDRTVTESIPEGFGGREEHSERVAHFLRDSRETAIKFPMTPRGYKSPGDNTADAIDEANDTQLTTDDIGDEGGRFAGENYRLSVHNAKQVARRDAQR